MPSKLQFSILPQPDDTTCGPTALHALYRFYRDDIALARVIDEIEPLETGGTLAVTLACHALRRGYRAIIYTYNLQLFDPSWFAEERDLAERLSAQVACKSGTRLVASTRAYLEYLELGGEVRFKKLCPELLRKHLQRKRPILTGLSATYLYSCARETTLDYDDLRGEPCGHFVVLYGYNPLTREVQVADPMQDNPRFGSGYYTVGADRLMGAILLGILTYDANLLIVTPAGAPEP